MLIIIFQKGITSKVTLGNKELKGWNHYRVFPNWGSQVSKIEKSATKSNSNYQADIPAFFVGHFNSPGQLHDTFLRIDGWKKGVAFLNGFNLGRYWYIGPQITLYAPAHFFKAPGQQNTLVLFETEDSPCRGNGKCTASFVKEHVLDAKEPQNDP